MQSQICCYAIMVLVLFSLPIQNVSFGHTIYPTPEEFYKDSDLIVVGKILSYDDDRTERRYQIEIKEFVKKPDHLENNKRIDIFGCNPNPTSRSLAVGYGCQTFENDQNVFLGLAEKQDKRFYITGGFIIQNQNCTGHQLLEAVNPTTEFKVVQNNKTTSELFRGIKTNLVYDFLNQDLLSKNLTMTFHVRHSSERPENETLTDAKQVLIDECMWHTVISTSFIPHKTGWYEICAEEKNSSMTCYGGITVVDKFYPPLKQFKSGISPYEIKCKENLVLIEKYDGSMACVKPETKTRLMALGWASFIIEANQNTIPEKTKNQIMDIVRSDMGERVENAEQIDFYPDTPSSNKETYFGLYYIDDKGTPFRVSNLDYAIAECKTLEVLVCGALNPSIIDSIKGKLVYDVEVTYHNDDGSLTAFYYVVDAKNGQIIYDGQNLR